MKKLMNKHTKIAFLALFVIITPAHCSQQSWYNSFVSEKNAYNLSVSASDAIIGFRTMFQRPLMAINPDKSIKMLKNKLALMEKNIRIAEEKEIYNIAQDNALNDEQTERLFQELKKLKISYKEFLNNSDDYGSQDADIPKENIAIIKKTLSNAQMNANNIHFINSNEPVYLSAETVTPCGFRTIENNTQDVSYEHYIDPLTMTFYPKFYQHDNTDQFATCIHEARHVIEGHCLSSAFIKFFIKKHNFNVEHNDINCQKLRQIQERQAEVLPSIQDKESALLMRAQRSNGYYENMLYGQHYLQLSDIDETHKMITYLENIKKYPHTPMPPTKEIRLNQFSHNNL